MRLCRFKHQGIEQVGFYADDRIVPLANLQDGSSSVSLVDYLPHGSLHEAAKTAFEQLSGNDNVAATALPVAAVELLTPIARPNKIFLLAGNYARHVEEAGDIARQRHETFPYVFMKPPSTTLTHPGQPVRIPAIAPDHVDFELELAVVIGRRVRGIMEKDALSAVAGYTIVNDISHRKFRPNSGRVKRDKDSFFDWLHGKWFDGFCPMGPCITSAEEIADPQQLELELKVNGQVRQHSSTSQQIFPVAAVIEFISSFVTLEPGDVISTGTPEGVGLGSGIYLRPGDVIEAQISSIGTLLTPMVGEDDAPATGSPLDTGFAAEG